ncbi:DNA mismatch repair endonuclease MutL [Commensalibacter sp. Nvir]|uniref:DNA mismatch repair endonuclease MutL n=1 Tax=Commensalibacter sp. Nvir TaxID=3069817 RepID=UPI0030C86D76
MTQERSIRTPTKIRQLSEHTINLIAAGEVVERPSAVVKELIENALDARARRICVRLDNGGIDCVQVTDDGYGMSPEELKLAVGRHCTSKIIEDDLIHIATLGFRGEALPSIGSVARLSIISRCEGASQAWQICVNGGKVGEPMPAAGIKGTEVTVKDLFYSTPARRKFLKTSRAETSRCEGVIQRLAVARPEVSFCYIRNDKTIFNLPMQSQHERILALFSDVRREELIPLDFVRDDLRLTGYIGASSVNRSTTTGQVLVVNQRPVIDLVMQNAVRVGYRDVLERGRHPVVTLFLSVPLDKIDVNVHPAKMELRFANEAAVRSLIIASIQKSLAIGAGHAGVHPESLHVIPHSFQHKSASIQYPSFQSMGVNESSVANSETKEQLSNLGESLSFRDAQSLSSSSVMNIKSVEQTPNGFTLGIAVAQIFKTYILSVTEKNEFVIVDQHAAHERLTHEILRKQYLENGIASQALLIPEVLEFTESQLSRLLAFKESLLDLGIEIEFFGGQSLIVRALPQVLGSISAYLLLKDLAEELEVDEQASPHETDALHNRLDAILARIACHHSVRAGRVLKAEEMNSLLRQMELTPKAGTCSHGRPTWLKWSKQDLEKLFGRS